MDIQLLQNEVFVTYKPFNRLMVSNKGRIYSKASNRILKTNFNENGYERISISVGRKENGKIISKNFKVHRLVMEAFIGNSKLTVNHKNLNKTDNRLENLEWMDEIENIKHAHKNGAYKNNGKYKRTKEMREKMRLSAINRQHERDEFGRYLN